VAAAPGRRRRADPRHKARQVPGGERGGRRRRAQRRAAEGARRGRTLGAAAGERYAEGGMATVENWSRCPSRLPGKPRPPRCPAPPTRTAL